MTKTELISKFKNSAHPTARSTPMLFALHAPYPTHTLPANPNTQQKIVVLTGRSPVLTARENGRRGEGGRRRGEEREKKGGRAGRERESQAQGRGGYCERGKTFP